MGCRPELIVMLTYNDHTVENAREIFEECKDSKAKYWGFKEKPLPVEEMKALFDRMRECGKKTVLEVVEYDEDECIKGTEIAVQCGCDIMMGTTFFESVSDYCKEHKISYLPFVGDVFDRPSVLDGSAEDMIESAKEYIKNGAGGIDLFLTRSKSSTRGRSLSEARFLTTNSATALPSRSIKSANIWKNKNYALTIFMSLRRFYYHKLSCSAEFFSSNSFRYSKIRSLLCIIPFCSQML